MGCSRHNPLMKQYRGRLLRYVAWTVLAKTSIDLAKIWWVEKASVHEQGEGCKVVKECMVSGVAALCIGLWAVVATPTLTPAISQPSSFHSHHPLASLFDFNQDALSYPNCHYWRMRTVWSRIEWATSPGRGGWTLTFYSAAEYINSDTNEGYHGTKWRSTWLCT